VTVQGVGSEWISDKNGIPVEFQYKYLARHGWDNYDDQVTYDQDYAQIEYRERTQAQTKDNSQSPTVLKL